MPTLFEQTVLSQLSEIRRELSLLSRAQAFDSGREIQAAMATQADVDALRDRLATVDANEQAALQAIKDDIDQIRGANPALDLTDLDAKVAALESDAGAEQQVAQDNAPPAPPQPAP